MGKTVTPKFRLATPRAQGHYPVWSSFPPFPFSSYLPFSFPTHARQPYQHRCIWLITVMEKLRNCHRTADLLLSSFFFLKGVRASSDQQSGITISSRLDAATCRTHLSFSSATQVSLWFLPKSLHWWFYLVLVLLALFFDNSHSYASRFDLWIDHCRDFPRCLEADRKSRSRLKSRLVSHSWAL